MQNIPIMALIIITISCLMNPLSAEILVPRMQICGKRSGWKAVRLRAEAPATAVTKHILWENGRTGRITDFRVSPARDCTLSLNPIEDATFTPPITSFQDTRMELICKNYFELNIRGSLFKYRQMSVARRPPLPCLCNRASELERTLISECLGRRFADTITTHSLDNEEMTLWCMNASITLTIISRALRNNAYFTASLYCSRSWMAMVGWTKDLDFAVRR